MRALENDGSVSVLKEDWAEPVRKADLDLAAAKRGKGILLGLIRVSGKRTLAQATPFEDLACEVRHAGIDRGHWPEVRAAHVECSGAVSVLRHDWARPAQKKDA